MPLANGEVFAGYRILRTLGVGGMGEVYLVAHPRLPRQDALKILPASMSADPEFRARFNREAELAATLYHPHIVGIHDRGEWAGRLWISMDYIDGPDAGTLLRDRYPGGMPIWEVAHIVSGVADALDYAHDRGLLHRDVKPPNILLTSPVRGRRRVLLADFGIARNAAETSGLTDTNVTLGTVNYAAPEQLMGLSLDGRADQYGLAATAYHLFTGSPMFGTSNPAVVISRHLNAPPPRLCDHRPELASVDPVVAKALSKRPADRFNSCGEFAEALQRAGRTGAAVPAAPPPPASQHTAVLPREPWEPTAVEESAGGPPSARWRWILAGVTLMGILAGVVLAVWPHHDTEPVAGQRDTPRTPVTTGTTNATTATTATTTATAAPVTFEEMRDLVTGFYGRLPGDAMGAWNSLDTHYQQRNGRDDYLGFWSSIRSVSVLSVTPRDATSVVARVRYELNDGRVDTEDRWLSVVDRVGRLLIYDSERIGPA